MSAQNVGGVSIRSRNSAPSRKGCVVNGLMTKANNKGKAPTRQLHSIPVDVSGIDHTRN